MDVVISSELWRFWLDILEDMKRRRGNKAHFAKAEEM